MAALHENLDAADRRQFVELLVDLVERQDVMIVVALGAVERAELAVHVADVRVVDVAVDDVGDDLVALAIVGGGLGLVAAGIGERGEVGGPGVVVDFQRLGLGNALAGQDLGNDDIFQRRAHKFSLEKVSHFGSHRNFPSFPSSRLGTRLLGKLLLPCHDCRRRSGSFADTGVPRPELGNEGSSMRPLQFAFAFFAGRWQDENLSGLERWWS